MSAEKQIKPLPPKAHPQCWKRIVHAWDCMAQTKFDLAERHLHRGLRLAYRLKDRSGQAHLIHGIGCLHLDRNQYAEALERLQESLVIFEELQDRLHCAMARANMANIYSAQGLHDEAEFHYRELGQFHEEVEGKPNQIVTLANLGHSLYRQGKYEEAAHILAETLAQLRITEEGDIKRLPLVEAEILNSQALLAFEFGQRKQGFALARQALQIAREIPCLFTQVSCLFILGQHARRGQCAQLEAALALSQQVGNHELTIEIQQVLAKVHEKAGRWKRALEAHQASDALYRQLFGPQALQRIELLRRKELTRTLEEAQRLRQEAQHAASHDSLTDLYNRRSMDIQLQQYFHAAQKTSQPLAVVLMDIDNFKRINDTFGHATGDQVIKRIAALLCEGVRPSDLVGRYGGEEFVVVIVGLKPKDAWRVCNRIRQRISKEPWEKLAAGLAVTISAGVCADPSLASHEKMLQAADSLLYEAKRHGKNQVRDTLSLTPLGAYTDSARHPRG